MTTMEASPEIIGQLAHYLTQTTSPDVAIRKGAEQALSQFELQQNFPIVLLHLVQSAETPAEVRLAGAIYFKNFVRKNWSIEDGTDRISQADRQAIKAYIVGMMLALPSALQLQIADAVTKIAEIDFPAQWQTLLPDLTSRLNHIDFSANIGILQTAHSIFKRYRSATRTDELFVEIKFVLEQFAMPLMQYLQALDATVEQNAQNATILQTLMQNIFLIAKIFYDLNCQDLPEFFEDNQATFMGLFQKYLAYENPVLETDDDADASEIEKVKAAICENIDLYAKRYEEDFQSLPQFVETVWVLLTRTGLQPKYDLLVSKAIGFLTSVVKPARHRALFENPETLRSICEKIVLPNMGLRESDEELFEDDPIEFIRRDMEGQDTDTRRRAASDLVRGLLEHFAKEVTEIFTGYVALNLQNYEANPSQNWKAKDTALYLITALSARSTTVQSGVTKVNEFIEIIPVFTQHILPDLQTPADSASHPIIKVDAIKFLMVFRSQLSKEQLLGVFPYLLNHLASDNYVVYTYAAVCMERILATKMPNGAFLFHEGDIVNVAHPILKHICDLIERNGQTPAKLAENDYLMKAAMRIIIVAKHDLEPAAVELVQRLGNIISVIMKNPSNPKFNHYTFEALAALIRFICARKPALVAEFETLLLPMFQSIMKEDVAEFKPYVFQLLSLMLDYHADGSIPELYRALLNELLVPALWESKGNIPALIRLLQSYVAKGPTLIAEKSVLNQVLGVCNMLIRVKSTAHFGFDLLATLFENVPMEVLNSYMKPVFVLILTCLSNNKGHRYMRDFVNFMARLFVIQKPDFNVDMIISTFDSLQPTPLFANILQNVIIKELEDQLTPEERKTTIVGFTNVLSFSTTMTTEPYQQAWCVTTKVLHVAI
ncbi:Cse1-domain-containing protein [Gaertneriomyces semiglobifer]|nr:Cse1-domain-containing protein [Gaertneriomyces semiglobifer]